MKSSKTYWCGTLRWTEFKVELLASAWPTRRTLICIQVQLHFALWNFSGELSLFLENGDVVLSLRSLMWVCVELWKVLVGLLRFLTLEHCLGCTKLVLRATESGDEKTWSASSPTKPSQCFRWLCGFLWGLIHSYSWLPGAWSRHICMC